MFDKALNKMKKFVLEEDVDIQPDSFSEIEVNTVEIPETLQFDGQMTIEEIYGQFGIINDNSILKVSDFIKTLPESLPTDIKRQTVIGVLGVSGLKIENLLDDAQNRINSLNAVADECYNNTNANINNNKNEIEELKNKIDTLKQENNDSQKYQEVQISLINEEITKINEIVNFINPK